MNNDTGKIKGGVGALAVALGATVGAQVMAQDKYVVVDPGTGVVVGPGTGGPPEVAAPGQFLKIEVPERAKLIKFGDSSGQGLAEFVKLEVLPAVQK